MGEWWCSLTTKSRVPNQLWCACFGEYTRIGGVKTAVEKTCIRLTGRLELRSSVLGHVVAAAHGNGPVLVPGRRCVVPASVVAALLGPIDAVECGLHVLGQYLGIHVSRRRW